MTPDVLADLIDAQQHLADRTGLQSRLNPTRTVLEMPDGVTVYFSNRRRHYVLSCNFNERYNTAIAAVDEWAFYLKCKLNALEAVR
jgi:hypothetical protein